MSGVSATFCTEAAPPSDNIPRSVQLPMKTPPICSQRTMSTASSVPVTPTTSSWASLRRGDISDSSRAPQAAGTTRGAADVDDEGATDDGVGAYAGVRPRPLPPSLLLHAASIDTLIASIARMRPGRCRPPRVDAGRPALSSQVRGGVGLGRRRANQARVLGGKDVG